MSWNRHKNTHATALNNAVQKPGPWKNFTSKQSKLKKKKVILSYVHTEAHSQEAGGLKGSKWTFKDAAFKDPKYFIYVCTQELF